MTSICIACPELPERRQRAESHFRDVGLNVCFLDAFHAATFGILTHNSYDVDNPNLGYVIPKSQLGLFLSHYMAWNVCKVLADTHGEAEFMILEDDALFVSDWISKLWEAKVDLPEDWDILYVGSGNCMDKNPIQIKGVIYEVKYPQCTHAYIVRSKALPVLLDTQRKCWAPIDLALIFNTLPKLKVYTVLPRIASQFGQEIAP